MKHISYLMIFLSFVLFKIPYNGIIVSLLQAQTTPHPESVDNLKREEILKSLGFKPYKYEHNPRNRDPFISLRQGQEEQEISKSEIINQTMLGPYLPLERFDVDQYQLMGIIWDTDEPRALIMDPNNQSHVVKKNDRIGLYKGYLAEIREGEIIIAEPSQQGLKVQFNIKTLTIAKKEIDKQKKQSNPRSNVNNTNTNTNTNVNTNVNNVNSTNTNNVNNTNNK